MTDLDGASVLLTGASSGIGRAAAVALARRGARLMISGTDTERLGETARLVGGRSLPADLSDPDATRRLLEQVLADGLPDVVIHNAGLGMVAGAGAQHPEDVDRLVRVNLTAPVEMTGALLPAMRRRGSGHLAFVTSIAAHLGVADESAYAATKAGLGGYAASLRSELAGSGLVVSVLAPGVVDTPFFARRGADYGRRFPRPISAGTCAAALVRVIEEERSEQVVPGWLRLPIALRAVAPNLYVRLEKHLS